MRRGLDWYKREPRAFLEGCRSAHLTDRQIAVYTVVLDLIYDFGGETPDDPKHIASYFSNLGAAAVRAAIQQLVDAGKLFRVDGYLHQKRAENEAKTRRNLSETRAFSGRLGGVSSGFSRRDANKNNDLSEATASSKHEAEREKEREKKKEEPIGSSKEKPPPKPRRKPEVPLPEGWVPNDRNIADATARGFTEERISHEAQRFRDYHLAKGTLYRDWDAAWRTWLGNATQFGARGGMAGGSLPFGGGYGSDIPSIVARRRLEGKT